MPVFPDDICWLTGSVHVNFATQEGLIVSIVFQLNCFVINIASAFTFFTFEGQETIYWSLHFVEQLLRVVQSLDNFIVDFDVFFPFLLPDVLTPRSKILNDFSIVESESNYSYFDWSFITFRSINTEPWELSQSLFHFIFNI